MAFIDQARALKIIGHGKRSVIYRDARGYTFDAVVLGEGASASQLDLAIPSRTGGIKVLADVDLATTLKSTDAWFLPGP